MNKSDVGALNNEWRALGGWDNPAVFLRLHCSKWHKLGEVWRSKQGLAFTVNHNGMRVSVSAELAKGLGGAAGFEATPRRTPDEYIGIARLLGESNAPSFVCNCRSVDHEAASRARSELLAKLTGLGNARPKKVRSVIVGADGGLTFPRR